MNLLEKNVQQFQHDGKIEKGHDWIDEWNCLRTKYFYRDYLHLVELKKNKKLSNIIIKAIKHSNLTIPMNTSKYKATTVLTGDVFPPLSRHSSKTFSPKFLSIMPPHENTFFSEIVRQAQDSRWNIISGTKTLRQTIATGHEIKIKKKKLNSHQDLSNNSATTPCYQ